MPPARHALAMNTIFIRVESGGHSSIYALQIPRPAECPLTASMLLHRGLRVQHAHASFRMFQQVWTDEGRAVLSAIDQLPEPEPFDEEQENEQVPSPSAALEGERASHFDSKTIADPKTGEAPDGCSPLSRFWRRFPIRIHPAEPQHFIKAVQMLTVQSLQNQPFH